MILRTQHLLLTTLLLWMCLPVAAYAQVTIDIIPPDTHASGDAYAPGTVIPVAVVMNTRSATVGAAEGVLRIPPELAVRSVSSADSVFSLWVKEPAVDGNTISFVGGAPGGVTGTGTVFSAVLEVVADDTAHVYFDSARALSFAAQPQDVLRRAGDAWYPFALPRTIPDDFRFERTHEGESRSTAIGYLEICLLSEDMLDRTVTGVLDAALTDALRAFQEREGIVPSGLLTEATRVALNRVCARHALPAQLFDISLTIDDRTLVPGDALSSRVVFESFGQVPTDVEIAFTILNTQGDTLYEVEDFVTVETQRIVPRRFDDVALAPGSYMLVVRTRYGDDIRDEFTQPFTVLPEDGTESGSWIIWLLLALGVVALWYITRDRGQHTAPRHQPVRRR